MLKLDKNNPYGVARKFAKRQKRGKSEYAEFTARHPQTKQLPDASQKKINSTIPGHQRTSIPPGWTWR